METRRGGWTAGESAAVGRGRVADARLAAGGAIASAIGAAASWLCCLPFALGALGSAGAGLSQLLGPLRPFVTLASVGLLGLAFYQVYRRPVARCGGKEGCDPGIARSRRRFLWVATALALVFITVPYWLNWLIYWTL